MPFFQLKDLHNSYFATILILLLVIFQFNIPIYQNKKTINQTPFDITWFVLQWKETLQIFREWKQVWECLHVFLVFLFNLIRGGNNISNEMFARKDTFLEKRKVWVGRCVDGSCEVIYVCLFVCFGFYADFNTFFVISRRSVHLTYFPEKLTILFLN